MVCPGQPAFSTENPMSQGTPVLDTPRHLSPFITLPSQWDLGPASDGGAEPGLGSQNDTSPSLLSGLFFLQKSSLGKGVSHGVNGSVDTVRCVNFSTFERLRTWPAIPELVHSGECAALPPLPSSLGFVKIDPPWSLRTNSFVLFQNKGEQRTAP